MKNKLSLVLLSTPCFAPMFWRLFGQGFSNPIGLLSDGVSGLALFLVAWGVPHFLRILLLASWTSFQIGAWELHSAMQRFPSWEDLKYLTDLSFVENSAAGFHISYPWLSGIMAASLALACFFPVRRPVARTWCKGVALALCLLSVQIWLGRRYDNQSLAARYNPMHWFVGDAVSQVFRPDPVSLAQKDLPENLREADLDGASLIGGKGAAKNVLIIALEGIPGLYHPEIAKAMGVASSYDGVVMRSMADTTADAMLIPDFVAHSHQTIRGLYSILCGDFSKLSSETTKAVELLQDPMRAADCLPAQMAKNGWSTHYLQAANLMFMGKDRFMPAIGFQQVHGAEWFAEPNPYPFSWGPIDPVFFRGAKKYIDDLRQKGDPWMLALLTVGTHQPYAAPDDIAAKYPSRKLATVAILDEAVGEFIEGLRRDGVLEDTLVVLTSDESHGSELADWVSSWGLGVVLAPEKDRLPRIKQGTFGLVDISTSVLDYLGLEIPPSLIGRSFFRDYDTGREMASNTAGKLRWRTEGGVRYECGKDGTCRAGLAPSILGNPPQEFEQASEEDGLRIRGMAAALDRKLASQKDVAVMKFAGGEIRKLPEKLLPESEWSENLVGAQYLDFPAGSKVHVSVKVKAVEAPENGIRLKLTIRQYESIVGDIPFPEFPVLRTGEEAGIEFDFFNPKEKKVFSFHLVGEGENARLQILEFDVTVDRRGENAKDKIAKGGA